MGPIITDTGPLVAFLDQREEHHGWVCEQMGRLHEPLLTCEAVLVEAAYLLLRRGLPPQRFFQLFHRELIELRFGVAGHWPRLEQLMRQYRDTPMSLADACLVCLCETAPGATLFTLDRDFLFYRQHRDRKIPLRAPFA